MSLLALTTLIVAAAATVATSVAWHLWREARARAGARTRALSAAIDDRLEPDVSLTTSAGAAFEPTSIAEPAGRQPLFASANAGGQAARRLVPAVGVGALVVSSVVTALLFVGGSRGSATVTPKPTPIELLSMRHAIERGDFVVRGLVRNPGGAQARDSIAVVVFLFDDKGGFITSAKAAVDFTKLGPGEESPFLVTIPKPAGLERYRLSFRLADGSVLPHVDLREVK